MTANPSISFELRDFTVIKNLVKKCYLDVEFCEKALFKINNYQKNAAANKKFSCQTQLLGLESNLIMAMNFNLKINEAKSIIKAAQKYC